MERSERVEQTERLEHLEQSERTERGTERLLIQPTMNGCFSFIEDFSYLF